MSSFAPLSFTNPPLKTQRHTAGSREKSSERIGTCVDGYAQMLKEPLAKAHQYPDLQSFHLIE